MKDMSELNIAAKIENLETAQAFVAGELEAAGHSATTRAQIKIAVEEIFVNIASYAYDPEVGDVAIRVAAGDCIVIEFEDAGKPYDPLEKDDPDITAGAGEREIGGLGIFMVKSIMDAVEYRRKGDRNILRICKM